MPLTLNDLGSGCCSSGAACCGSATTGFSTTCADREAAEARCNRWGQRIFRRRQLRCAALQHDGCRHADRDHAHDHARANIDDALHCTPPQDKFCSPSRIRGDTSLYLLREDFTANQPGTAYLAAVHSLADTNVCPTRVVRGPDSWDPEIPCRCGRREGRANRRRLRLRR